MAIIDQQASPTFRSDVPARLDRLPWSRWHWMVVTALGITWIIDGLEVTMMGAVSTVLQEPQSLHFSGTEIGLLGTAYLAGAVLGALVFGYLTDRLGRKKLFTVTLGLYLVAAFLTAISWNFISFALLPVPDRSGDRRRILGHQLGDRRADSRAGAGLGGPGDQRHVLVGLGRRLARQRGPARPEISARRSGLEAGVRPGCCVGLVIIALRRHVPESPRWLLTHGHPEEAERIVDQLERQIEEDPAVGALPEAKGWITIRPRGAIGFGELAGVMVRKYLRRTVLGLSLIISQAFLYNGVFFTFPLVLRKFYGIHPDRTGFYLLPFALSNFLGPLLLGRFFDTVGRKPMIGSTYTVSAVLLAATGYLFAAGHLTATTQTLLWAVIFFFASSAASSAYLTVSEIFPVELRGMVIALFFACGTLIGGTLAPWLFGALIDSGSRRYLFYGDLFGAALLLSTVGVVAAFGVQAERTSLEDIAQPLSAVEEEASSL